MTTFVPIGPRTWMRRATRGWVVYVGDTAHYFDEKNRDEAQAVYEQAMRDGVWASPPMPAHMGT